MTSELTIHITGMKCASCANRVQKALLAVPGVDSAQVYLDSKTARVRMDDSTPATDLIHAVLATGYEATLSTLP